MDFRPITIEELLQRGRAVFAEHHREVGIAPYHDPLHRCVLDVNEGGLLALERVGCLLTVAAFDGEDLVGYAIATVAPHTFTNLVLVSGLTFYVHPKHRQGGAGRMLLEVLTKAAYARGEAVHWHAKAGSVFEHLLRRTGARELERVYVLKEPTNG